MLRRERLAGAAALFLASAFACRAACACEVPPSAVIDIDANSYYSDARHSVIDPVRKARNEAAVKPVNAYLEKVARAANASGAAAGADGARCALAWLDAWAGQGALLGRMTTEQSYYTRKWTLSGLALNYARVRAAAMPQERGRIDAWLLALAEATMRHADAHKGVRNNHYYWEGLAVSAAGAVTGDARCLAWGRKVFDEAMGQVAPDGSLPQELARAGMALHYHLFAAAPLVMMASILDLRAPALDRLVAFSAAGLADPAAIEKITGVAQERSAGMPGWMAVYRRQHGDAPAPRQGADRWDARMGGDLTLPNPLEHAHAA